MLDLVPLEPQLVTAVDRYLEAGTWFPELLSVLRRNLQQLTSSDAEAYMLSQQVSGSRSPFVDDAINLTLVARDKGIEFARQWALTRLVECSNTSLPDLAFHALRELLFIPLTERVWDPLTEDLWVDCLWRYRRAVGAHVDLEDCLRFFYGDLLPRAKSAPNVVYVELKLAIAELYLTRPASPNSDHAHNVELALSHGMQALDRVNHGYGVGDAARVHELLGRTYMARHQQNSVQALESARYHFTEAFNAYDVDKMPDARAEAGRLIGWSMIELARWSFDPASRRKAITEAIDTLRRLPRMEAHVWSDAQLAEALALALNGEFDPNSLKDATVLIETLLDKTAADRPPPVRVVPSSEHEAHVLAVQRWANCRYIYADIAARDALSKPSSTCLGPSARLPTRRRISPAGPRSASIPRAPSFMATSSFTRADGWTPSLPIFVSIKHRSPMHQSDMTRLRSKVRTLWRQARLRSMPKSLIASVVWTTPSVRPLCLIAPKRRRSCMPFAGRTWPHDSRRRAIERTFWRRSPKCAHSKLGRGLRFKALANTRIPRRAGV